MKLSQELKKTFMVMKEYNENSYEFITKMLSFAPSIETALKYANSPTVFYEELGNLYGTNGNWKMIIRTDKKGAVNELNVEFKEAQSSNIEFADTYAFSVLGFNEDAKLFTNLVYAEKTRINNYRFAMPKAVKLSSEDIANAIKPELISRSTLSYSGNFSLIKTNSKTTNGMVETVEHRYPYNAQENVSLAETANQTNEVPVLA